MSSDIPQNLIDWLSHIGVEGHLNQAQIQNGKIVGYIMQAIVEGYKLQLLSSQSAVNRVSNWNNLINQLKKISIRVSQQDKTKIINGNHDIVFHIISKLKDYHEKAQKETEVDLSKLSLKNQITQSNSLLQLFILAIMKNFNLNSKESVALLSNQGKYLAHILAKGLKGDFRPIQNFVHELHKNMNLIKNFCKNKENELFFVRSVKPALISKSDAVTDTTLSLFSQFLYSISDAFEIIKDHLLNTFILTIKRHPYMTNKIIKFLLEVSDYHENLLMVLKANSRDVEFQKFFLELWEICKSENKVDNFLSFRGIKQHISNSIANLKNSEIALSSLNLIVSISHENSDLISGVEDGNSLIDNLHKLSLSKHAQIIVFVHQLFALLVLFGHNKIPLAPNLYKILISKYQETINEEQSRTYMRNFQEVVREFPSIPFNFVIEAINTRIEANTLKISEIQLNFFQEIAQNDSLDIKTALMIYNIVSKVILDETAFANKCTQIIISLIKKFSTENIFMDMSVKLVKVVLAVHFANGRKIGKKKSLTTNKHQTDDTILKSKNVSIENFLYKMSELEFAQVNTQIQPLICYSIIQLDKISNDHTKGLRKILQIFGKVPQILKKYKEQVQKMDEDGNKKEQKKRSKVKQSSYVSSGGNSRYQSPEVNRASSHLQDIKKKSYSKGDQSLNLSYLGVTPVAQKGLEKYQKFYLQKLEKVENQKNKQAQASEREAFLKKLFERKMIDKGISVKKVSEEDFQYLYEFDEKQKQLDEDKVRGKVMVPFYSPDNEEQRDTRGLEYSMKKYQRILKVLYSHYSGHHKPQKLDNFIQISEKYHLLTSSSLWKLLKQHCLDEYLTVKQVQFLCKKINKEIKKQFQDITCLDYEGFEQFILQVSFLMFTRPPKDLRSRPISQMVQETMSHFKLHSGQNRINEHLFEDPDNIYFNQTEAIKELNKKLSQNTDYILPQGYKKVVEKKVIFSHQIYLNAMSSVYKDVYEIINQILNKSFDVHLIEPFTIYETIAKARPTLYYAQRLEGEVNSEKMSVFMKKQVSKFPIKDREVAKQAASIFDEVIDAVELGHDRIGIKHENPVIKQKKLREIELKRVEEEQKRKRVERDRYIKSALTKHKEAREEKKKENETKKKQEKQKLEKQRKKRKQEEEALKKKVEIYKEKKVQEEKRRKQESKQKRQREREEFEKRLKDLEESKKRKEELKIQKEEQEKKRKEEELLENKRKKEQERRRFEEEQKRKKQMVEEYKSKKSQLKNTKVLDAQ